MITKNTFFSAAMLLVLLLYSCRRDEIEVVNRPTFVYNQAIVNPPDDFMILFNNLSVGQKFASLTFADSAVWKIDRIGDTRQTVTFKNDTGLYYVNLADSLAMAGKYRYEVIVTSSQYGETSNLFIGFKKIDRDYDTFEPKF